MINIVYPLKKSAWGKEIIYSLRSLQRHFIGPYQVHICGDYIPETDIPFIHHKFNRLPAKNTTENVGPILEWACGQFDDFLYMNDDFYLLKDTAIADLTPHQTIGCLDTVKMRGVRPWQKILWRTYDMLKEEGLPVVYNYETHTPQFYKSSDLLECDRLFEIFSGETFHATIYYNLFGHDSPKHLTEKAGFYRRGMEIDLSGEHLRFLSHDDNGLSEELKQVIEQRFAPEATK